LADVASSLPPPTPLCRGLRIDYQWGGQKFEIVATACSIRTTFWEDAGRDITWLHCKAIQTMNIHGDEPVGLMTVLIPAHYVTRAEPGPTFRLLQSEGRGDLGVFPPNQPPPASPVPLDELERTIAALVDPRLN
jgi:hypothetical protein